MTGSSDNRTGFLALTNEITRLFANVKEIGDVRRVIDTVVEHIESIELTGFYLVDPYSGRLKLIHHKGFPSEEEALLAEKTAWERHPGFVIRTGQILDEPDCDDRENARSVSSPRSFVVKSRLYVPVFHDGGTIGTFGFASSRLNAFSDFHLATLHFLGNMAGLAYQRIIARGALERREAILAAVARLADLLGSSINDKLLQECLAQLGEATGVSRVYIFENFTDERGVLCGRQTLEWVGPDITPQIETDILQAVPYAEAGFERWVEKLTANEIIEGNVADFPLSEQKILADQEIISLIVVPILVGDKWWGLMGFDECSRQVNWSQNEIGALKTAAHIIGTAFKRAADEHELRRRAEDQAVLLHNIETQVWYLKDPSTYGAVNRAHARMLGRPPDEIENRPMTDFLSFSEANECETSNLMVFSLRQRVASEEWIRNSEGDSRLLSIVKTPKLAADGTVEYVVASAEDITERWQAEQELQKAHEQLEMRVEQRTAELRETNERLETEIEERVRIEQKLIIHDHRLRSLASELTLVEERERHRIAQGIHDNIGQKLALANMRVGACMTRSSDEMVKQSLKSIGQLIEDLIHDSRTLIFELSLPILYELGIAPALDWLVDQTIEKGIECTFSTRQENPNIALNLRVVVFQMARELLANVSRHSQAKKAAVELDFDDGDVILRVIDDGIGFTWPMSAELRSSGYGLFSIIERLQNIGGGMKVTTAPGKGTVIELRLPE